MADAARMGARARRLAVRHAGGDGMPWADEGERAPRMSARLAVSRATRAMGRWLALGCCLVALVIFAVAKAYQGGVTNVCVVRANLAHSADRQPAQPLDIASPLASENAARPMH